VLSLNLKPRRNFWFFKRAKESVTENIKFDDATIEQLKNPIQEYVKPGKEKTVSL